MSKKKRRNRETSPETISLGLSASRDNNKTGEDVAQPNQSNETCRISYLKTRWLMVALVLFLALGALGAGLKSLEDSARQERSTGKTNNSQPGFFSKLNPFAANPTPTPAPQLSKEYIYAGSGGRLLTVEDANASAAPPADLAIWRPSDGNWWIMSGTGTQQVTQQWGLTGDIPAPGDFDGDGKTDFAIFRPSTGYWWVMRSSDSSYFSAPLGSNGDIPAVADYDGDGKSDLGTFDPDNGNWTILRSSDLQSSYFNFGLQYDLPAAADYNGDGQADIAIWRDSDKKFYIQTSSSPYYYTVLMNVNSSEPVSADYDGDGKANFAVRSGADWVIMNSALTSTQATSWQQSGDEVVQNDYDGDGKVDIAVWRDSSGNWYIKNSSDNSTRTTQWGLSGDKPVPALWKR